MEFYPYKPGKSKASIYGSQRGKTIYKTTGYKEVMIYDGVSNESYRQVVKNHKRRIRQESISVSHTSLRAQVKQEGTAIENEIQKICQSTFEEYNITSEDNCYDQIEISPVKLEKEALIKQAFEEVKQDAPKAIRGILKLDYSSYEDASKTVNISVDDVCSNRQKTTRIKGKKREEKKYIPRRKNGKKNYPKRKKLFQTVVHLQSAKGSYALYGEKVGFVIPQITAFLLKNTDQDKNWVFHVDGQRTLQDTISIKFGWKNIKLILDWYHLRKKINYELNMGVHRNEMKDEILTTLEQLAWYGLTEQAIAYIKSIEVEQIKNIKNLETLAGYFKRNRENIPNYALRKKLGLRNSSNIGEKYNDLIVAKRQKNNGMSWTKPGANSLGLIKMMNLNGETNTWLKEGKINFSWAA